MLTDASLSPAILNAAQIESTQAAIAFQSRLASIDLKTIPVLSLDRHIPRKDQAKLTRGLLKKLGLEGVSVTTPSYSGAQAVEVSLPSRSDYLLEPFGTASRDCPTKKANYQATLQMERLLVAAFPNSGDRSDSRSDYFDYRWSIR